MTYGKEPFDLRLTVLCLCRRLPLIMAVTLAGAILFGGGYYVKNVLMRQERLYEATSTYKVAYAAEEKDIGSVYINEMSWNTYIHSQFFLDLVRAHLAEILGENGGRIPENEALGGMIQAYLASDLRIPSTTVTTDSPEKSVWIARAVEAAMTEEFAGEIREIDSIEVIDPGNAAREAVPDVRAARALMLSGILSCFFAITAVLLHITGEDAIRLPATIWKRYGVKTVGTIKSRELAENIGSFFGEEARRNEEGDRGDRISPEGLLKNVAVCMVQDGLDGSEILDQLRVACPRIPARALSREGRVQEKGNRPESSSGSGAGGWFAVPSPLSRPESIRELREAEGILLVVSSGAHGGRQFAYVLEYLRQQGCKVTAALLWEADERLISWYYGFGRRK